MHLLNLAFSDIQRAKIHIKEAEKLVPHIESILRKTYKAECSLYRRILDDTIGLIGVSHPDEAVFELRVVQKLIEKSRTGKRPEEIIQAQKVLCKMQKIIKLSPKNRLLMRVAEKKKVDLSDFNVIAAFESDKRQSLSSIFSQACFDKKMLCQCIQESMIDKVSRKHGKEDTFHWEQAAMFFLIAVLVIHFFFSPSNFLSN